MTHLGQRNIRAQILAPVRTSDGHGGHINTWTLPAALLAWEWIALVPLTGAEAIRAAQVTPTLMTAVTMLYRDDLSAKYRIVLPDQNDRTLEIESYQDPDGRRAELRLLCTEVQA